MDVSAAKQAPAEQARRLRATRDPYSVFTIERAFNLLRAFSLRRPELGIPYLNFGFEWPARSST